MSSLTHVIAFLLAFSAATVRSGITESQEVEQAITLAQATSGESPFASSPPAVERCTVRSQMPAPPGPPRKCNDGRFCKRTSESVTIVPQTARLMPRPEYGRAHSDILWAQSVASSLQLQHVLLQI